MKSAGFPVVPAGSKCVQVKGRVALESPHTRFTPPGKAVREKHSAPGNGWLEKYRWLKTRKSRIQEEMSGGLAEQG